MRNHFKVILCLDVVNDVAPPDGRTVLLVDPNNYESIVKFFWESKLKNKRRNSKLTVQHNRFFAILVSCFRRVCSSILLLQLVSESTSSTVKYLSKNIFACSLIHCFTSSLTSTVITIKRNKTSSKEKFFHKFTLTLKLSTHKLYFLS